MIGYPVAGVKSPGLFNRRFEAEGRPERMVTLDVAPSALERLLQEARADESLLGIVTTAPHKARLFDLADRRSARAARIGAANAVRRRAGGTLDADMFDGVAFEAVVEAARRELRHARVGVCGVGAAGRACLAAALDAGANLAWIVDRDEGAVDALLGERVRRGLPGRSDRVSIAVNATPAGASPSDAPPFDVSWVEPGGLVVDLASGAAGSVLLSQARARGCATVDGAEFAAAQFESLWTFLSGP